MSTTMDKTQRAIMMVIPLVFITVVARFPAGLVLYWVTTNLWTVGQGLITRQLMPKKGEPAPKRSSRTPPRETAGDGAARQAPEPKPAAAAPPRKVKRKKKARR
jgi:YidC/Oxa1 family membrane protein insertase